MAANTKKDAYSWVSYSAGLSSGGGTQSRVFTCKQLGALLIFDFMYFLSIRPLKMVKCFSPSPLTLGLKNLHCGAFIKLTTYSESLFRTTFSSLF
jgi:hypothetical protein